jgi:hypothetical protein
MQNLPKEQPEQTSKVSTRGKKGLSEGIYLKGTVNGEDVVFTADTGASMTIISKRVYNKIPEVKCPVLDHSVDIVGAGGAIIRGIGRAEFGLTLGSMMLLQNVLVAEIEDDALLGYDILRGSNGEPADILLSRNKVVLNGVDIPIFQVGNEKRANRVVVADDVRLPGQTEAVVDVCVECFKDDRFGADFIIEPTAHFKEKYPLHKGKIIVSNKQGPSCDVRLINTLGNEITLRQDSEIKRVERIGRILGTFTEAEHAEDIINMNFPSIRRVIANENIAGPKFKEEYVKEMQCNSTEIRSVQKKKIIEGHFTNNEDIYLKFNRDTNLTDWTELPVQHPRKVLLAYHKRGEHVLRNIQHAINLHCKYYACFAGPFIAGALYGNERVFRLS